MSGYPVGVATSMLSRRFVLRAAGLWAPMIRTGRCQAALSVMPRDMRLMYGLSPSLAVVGAPVDSCVAQEAGPRH